MRIKLVFCFAFFAVAAMAQTGLPGKAIASASNLHKYLMNYYPFNGNANDESGHNKHGTVNGAALDNGVDNSPQSSYRFDGSQYISFPMDSSCGWSQYTIMGWNKIYYGEGNISLNRHILSIGDMQSGGAGMIQYPPCSGCQYYQGIYYNHNMTPSEFSTLQGFAHGASWGTTMWRHYALVIDSIAHSWEYYLQGSNLAGYYSPIPFSTISLAKGARIGCRFDNMYFFKGWVDEVRIYNRALSSCEIKALINEPPCYDTLCLNSANSVYYAEADNATSYQWNVVPANAAVLTPQGDSCIVDWNNTWAGTAMLLVNGLNGNGAGVTDTLYTLITLAPAPVISVNGDTLTSNIASGNQWYLNNVLIPGAINQTHVATQTGSYFSIVTQNDCPSDTSNKIPMLFHTGVSHYASNGFSISPNPSNGIFTMESSGNISAVEVLSVLGEKVHSVSNTAPLTSYTLDIRNQPKGVYIYKVYFEGDKMSTGKIIIE